jgi:predicted transcriptional regulator
MLEPLFGSANRERILVYLLARKEGYAREIARFFATGLDPVQKQLDRLEFGGVLFSRKAGQTRLFGLNPRYPFMSELTALLRKTLDFYPPAERRRLEKVRRRPRRKGKPL